MRHHLQLILKDPVLRMSAIGTLAFGGIGASIGPYQSLIGTREFGLSEPAYAAVLMGALAIAVLVSVGIGIITDQRPSRRAMALVATWGNLLASLLVWLLPAKASFVIAHIVLIPLGATLFGQLLAVARLSTQHMAPNDRDGVLAIIRACLAIPYVCILPLWSIGLDHGLDMTAIYPGIGVFALINLALIIRDWPRDADAPWTEVKSGIGFRAALGEMLNGPILLRVQLMGILQAGNVLGGIITGLVLADAGRPTAHLGLFYLIFVGIEVVTTLSIGTLLRWFTRMQLITTGVIFYALFVALLPLLAATPFLWALTLLAGMGGGLIYTLTIAYLADLMGARAGAGASLMALQRVGQDLAATGAFWFGTAFGGYVTAGITGAILTLVAMAAILILDARRAGRPI